MCAQAFDPAEFKRQQRDEWNTAAPGWTRWWPLLEKGMQPVSDRLVEMVGVKEGSRVLDVATGSGEPAATAARKVGRGGRVVATDQAPAMLQSARERAARLGLKNIDFVETDAETLDVRQSGFDAVLCRCGLMFLPDLEKALGRMRDLLRPGGRIAAAVWSSADKVPLLSLAGEAIRKIANLPPPPSGALDLFKLADRDLLEKTFTAAGFQGFTCEAMIVTYEFASVSDFVEMRRDLAAPFRKMLESQAPEVQKKILEAIRDAAREYVSGDGAVRMDNEALCVTAHN